MKGRRGFTLIEMLIVVLLIGAVAALALPDYRRSRLRAQGADLATRAEAINVAIKSYEADYQAMPAGSGPVGDPPAYLTPYIDAGRFRGPGGITFQLSKPDAESPPMLIVAASSDSERQILLAAAGTLGNLAVTIGGGASIAVALTH